MKRVLCNELDGDISAFVDGKENITQEELYSNYGEPQDVVDSLFTKKDYSRQLKRAKRLFIPLAVVSIVLVVALFISILFIVELIDTYGYTGYVGDAQIVRVTC